MEYTDYTISETVMTETSGIYNAWKTNAASKNGIIFSHKFYFKYSENGKDLVNGEKSSLDRPGMDDNFYIAIVNGGVILSLDMEKFMFKPSARDYMHYDRISQEDLKKFHNVDPETED